MDQQPQLAVGSFDLVVLTAMAVVLDLGPPQLVDLGQAVAVDLGQAVAVDLEVHVVAVDLVDLEDYSVSTRT